MRWYVKAPSVGDTFETVSDMRPEECADIKSLTGTSPILAVSALVERTPEVRAVYSWPDHDLIGLYGVRPGDDISNLWVLTRRITGSMTSTEVVRESRSLADSIYEEFGPLYSIINKTNRRTQALAYYMGFSKGDTREEYLGSDLTFQEVIRR